MSEENKAGELQPRMVILEGDPCVIRDTYTDRNFTLANPNDAYVLADLINIQTTMMANMVAAAKSLMHLEDVKSTEPLADYEEYEDGGSSLDGEEETHG